MQILGIRKLVFNARIRAKTPVIVSHLSAIKLALRAKSLHSDGVNYTLAII